MIKRFFTDTKKNPYDSVQWRFRKIGKLNIQFPVTFSDTQSFIAFDKYFKTKGVPSKSIEDIPKLGTDSFRKFTWKQDQTNNSQISFKQLVHRLSGAWAITGLIKGYFSEEQAQIFYDQCVYALVNQMFAPNSPQWFNTGIRWAYGLGRQEPGYYYVDQDGVTKQYSREINKETQNFKHQVSACYIHEIKDSLLGEQSITDMLTIQTRLFANGSGNGFNVSSLRAQGQQISAGGKSSGVMSFLKIFDRNADSIKSGGKTRRSASNRILDIDHPQIQNFIKWKIKEQRKIRDITTGSKINNRFLKKIYDKVKVGKQPKQEIIERLIHNVEYRLIQKTIDSAKQGFDFEFDVYDKDFNGQATKTVSGQNANNNIAITNDFINSVISDTDFNLIYRKNRTIAKTIKARKILKQISKRAWQVGDPGLYYIDNTNDWNTCLDTVRINAANPCQQYLNVSNTSCNLRSVNLIKFKKGKVDFNSDKFIHVVELAYLAAQISNQIAVSPSKLVAQGTFNYRPVGIGFMNLGGLLMSMAVPYNSSKAHSWAGIISSIMTGTCYKKSIQVRQKKGPFPKYRNNQNSVLRVLNNHYSLLKKQSLDRVTNIPMNLDFQLIPKNMYDLSLKIWKKVNDDVKKYGIRNNVVTCIRPTGTIGLLMDSGGTMSSEPEYSLIRSKKLSQGGYIYTATNYVQPRLKCLEYTQTQIEQILQYITQNKTIEGSPYLKPQHLNIFDCAVPSGNGNRFVSIQGHLKMMGAITGYISMGISKTVNLPTRSTSEQIYNLFIQGWRMGLKALTVFRDNCRLDSPMAGNSYDFMKNIDLKKIQQDRKFLYKPVRKKLPQRRIGYTQQAMISGHKVFIRTGEYHDGTLGEVFIDIYKQGSFARTAVNLLAKLASKRLQYGVPAEEVIDVFLNVNQQPKGMVNHPNIKMAQSMFDFIGRLLSYRYLGRNDLVHNPDKNTEVKQQVIQKKIDINQTITQKKFTGQRCSNCGSYSMIKSGNCHVCNDCGTTTGCS